MNEAAVTAFFTYAAAAMQLIDSGTAMLQRLKALQEDRAARGVELTADDLRAEFAESEMQALKNMSVVLKALADKRASLPPG
jgi:predicted NBD/HSP70 family sugar kinase